MADGDELTFDPVEMRSRLAARNESFAEFLRYPLYSDEAAAKMPGLYDDYAYRALPPEEQVPPGLSSGDFADAFRDIPHPAGVLEQTRAQALGGQRNSLHAEVTESRKNQPPLRPLREARSCSPDLASRRSRSTARG